MDNGTWYMASSLSRAELGLFKSTRRVEAKPVTVVMRDVMMFLPIAVAADKTRDASFKSSAMRVRSVKLVASQPAKP